MASRLGQLRLSAVLDGSTTSGAAPGEALPREALPIVKVRGLVRGFGKRNILNDVGLELRPGEFVALLGRSGSGKSTLLRALAELDDTGSGSGELELPENRAVVFQDARLLPWARVLDNVILGLGGPDARARGEAALAEVGLAGRERAWPIELSGGEQQRAALARSLVRQPALLLADEPFGALDALTRMRMHELLRELCARHQPAVLLVTHDVDEAIVLADRVLVLVEGQLAVDQRIDLPVPRSYRDPRFANYREALLAALGVVPGGAIPTVVPTQLPTRGAAAGVAESETSATASYPANSGYENRFERTA